MSTNNKIPKFLFYEIPTIFEQLHFLIPALNNNINDVKIAFKTNDYAIIKP